MTNTVSGAVFGERMLITKSDISHTYRDTSPTPAIGEGEVLFAIRRIALTANNVTYAAAGDLMGYWRFFPGPDGCGILPVWGFGEVVDSRADGIAAGDRFYGYWPLATYLVVQTANVGAQGFADPSPHRQGLSDFYNRYTRAAARDADDEAVEALFRPLFMTGWLIDRFLGSESDFGAGRIVMSSASSKTAIAAAFCLSRRDGGRPEIVGLTSAGNRDYVEGLGSFDTVLGYDDIAALDPEISSVFVDFAGDRALTLSVHDQLGTALKHSAIIGMTRWRNAGGDVKIPGPTPTFFFAPTIAEAVMTALGPAGFAKASEGAWDAFAPYVRARVDIETRSGMEAAEAAYRELVSGRVRGGQAIVVEL